MTAKKTAPTARPTGKRARKPLPKSSADAHGDFFFDELMTAQPDATQAYYRAQLMKRAAPKSEDEGK